MNQEGLTTKIESQKKLNQTLRMFGVPFPLWITSFLISIVSYHIFRYYALYLIVPLYLFLAKIGRIYSKKGKDHYLRSLFIRKITHKKIYKTNKNLIKEL